MPKTPPNPSPTSRRPRRNKRDAAQSGGISACRRDIPRQIVVPRPNPREAALSRLDGACRRGKPYKRLNWYAYPAGADFCSCKSQQNTLGALPQDPSRLQCWIRIEFRREPKFNPYCAQIRSQGSHGRICPFPPPPFPTRERGPDGRVRLGRQFGARGMLGFAGSQAANPWLWLAGLAVCTEREGVPLPRSGGGWEGADAPAAPYKHRLAHDPGRQSRSGRAFRCVGFSGRSPE